MRVNRQTADNIKAINAAIAAQNDEHLRDVLMSIGVEDLLNPDMMHLARGSHFNPVVILLATIGAENSPDPAQYVKILNVYQALVTHRSSGCPFRSPADARSPDARRAWARSS